jgi:hypothetical protein
MADQPEDKGICYGFTINQGRLQSHMVYESSNIFIITNDQM